MGYILSLYLIFMHAIIKMSCNEYTKAPRFCSTTNGFYFCPLQVSLTVCKRKSPHLPRPPSRSRSSPRQSASTPSGSVAPSWLRCPPSSRCGSPSRSMTSPVPASSTASASKHPSHPNQINISSSAALVFVSSVRHPTRRRRQG